VRGSGSRDDDRGVPEAVEGRHVTDTVEEAYRSGEPQIFFVNSGRCP